MTTLSVSQVETYLSCPRKWWWERVQKKGAAYTPNTFGTALHSCLERAVKGKNPFPAGWEYVYDKFSGKETGRLTNNEQALVKMLVHKATEAGWMAVHPNYEVEKSFNVSLLPGVRFMGFIDLVEPGIITDYKSTSAMKWAETEETLKDNIQLLAYAKICGFEGATLRHKVLCKSPPSVKLVEVTVNGDRINQEWDKIKICASEMVALKSVSNKDDVRMDMRACNEYGGCSFKYMCFPEEQY